MGGDHDLHDDNGAAAIAAEWGVPVNLLDEVEWELEERDGNDGEVYGYYVRFSEDTDPAILSALGVGPGDFLRDLSVNAFDTPEPDDPNEHVAYLARQYKHLGGANGAIVSGEIVLLNPWTPSAPAAQEFWDKNIGILPVENRRSFLIELSKHGW